MPCGLVQVCWDILGRWLRHDDSKQWVLGDSRKHRAGLPTPLWRLRDLAGFPDRPDLGVHEDGIYVVF